MANEGLGEVLLDGDAAPLEPDVSVRQINAWTGPPESTVPLVQNPPPFVREDLLRSLIPSIT